MKLPTLLSFALSTVLVVSAAFAADASPAPAPAPAKKEKPETELEGKMDKMNGAFRKLRRQAGDATKNAESLALVATMREYAELSAKLVPARAAEIPEADRAKWVAAYQAKIHDLVALIGKLETALKAGQNEDAAKIVQDMGALQKEGHKEYKMPEKQ